MRVSTSAQKGASAGVVRLAIGAVDHAERAAPNVTLPLLFTYTSE